MPRTVLGGVCDQCVCISSTSPPQLLAAARAFRGAPEILTPLHTDAVLLCAMAKMYKEAIPLLDEPVLDVNPGESAITPKDLMLYFYYGGVCYMAMKKFGRASCMFTLCCSAPTSTLSAIMIAAWKKLILCSLLSKGEEPTLPRYVNPIIGRQLRQCAPEYTLLARCYLQRHTEDLIALAERTGQLFLSDGNVGVVKQVINSLIRRNIKRLNQTYMTLSLSDIARTVGLQGGAGEVELLLLRMIEDGEIAATIDKPQGQVSFHQETLLYESVELLERLEDRLSRGMRLYNRIVGVEEDVECSPANLKRLAMAERGAHGGNTVAAGEAGAGSVLGMVGEDERFAMALQAAMSKTGGCGW